MPENQPNVTKLDGVNYVRRTVPTGSGNLTLEGMTARSLIKALQSVDPDDLVCYMAENTPETRQSDLLIGVSAGVLSDSPHGVTFIVGPESIRALAAAGVFQ